MGACSTGPGADDAPSGDVAPVDVGNEAPADGGDAGDDVDAASDSRGDADAADADEAHTDAGAVDASAGDADAGAGSAPDATSDGDAGQAGADGPTCLPPEASLPPVAPTCTVSCPEGTYCAQGNECAEIKPACMPDGGLCDARHKCCSGAPCCGGICGSRCVSEGGGCDDKHRCCSTATCTNGKCVVTNCHIAGFNGCTDQKVCCGGSSSCYCSIRGQGPSGLIDSSCTDRCQLHMACVNQVCVEIEGCLLPGMLTYSVAASECCSGSSTGVDGGYLICK